MSPSHAEGDAQDVAPGVIAILTVAAAIGGFAYWFMTATFRDEPDALSLGLALPTIVVGGMSAPVSFPVVAGSLWATGLLRRYWLRWTGILEAGPAAQVPVRRLPDRVRELAIALAVSAPVYFWFPLLLSFSSMTTAENNFQMLLGMLSGSILFFGLGMAGLWIGAQLSLMLAPTPRDRKLCRAAVVDRMLGRATLCCAVFLGAFFSTTFLLPQALIALVSGLASPAHHAVVYAVIGAAFTAGIAKFLRSRSLPGNTAPQSRQ